MSSDVHIIKVTVPNGTPPNEVVRIAEEEARKLVGPDDWVTMVTPRGGVAVGGPLSNDMQWTVEYQILPPGGSVARTSR